MTQQEIQTLIQIYNNLLSIHTNGDDTFMMSDCMRALKSFIYKKQEEINKEEEKDE